MSAYRPEFEAAARLLAAVTKVLERRGRPAPILVGGGAVELYSAGRYFTGDFDLVTPDQEILEQVLQDHGFQRPSGVGQSLRGWVHPDLHLGFEVVSATLLGGLADRTRVRFFTFGDAGRLFVVSVEDMIADRMGQYASGTAREMLHQARELFALYQDNDKEYLERRIREETNNEYGIADLHRAP